MSRRTLASLMLIAAIATTVGMIPGLAENLAFAQCDMNDTAGCNPLQSPAAGDAFTK